MPIGGKYRYASSRHMDKADDNSHFSLKVDSQLGGYNDWQVTSLFYSALHLVQAYFSAQGGVYPTRHGGRRKAIRADKNLRTIRREYHDLKTMSETARYYCLPINADDVYRARACLEKIRDHIVTLL